MKVVTVRIDEKDFKDIERIEKEEKTDRAEVMRKLLAKAISEWKLKKALELLREHKITIRKASKLAEVSYIEMMDLASRDGIEIGYTLMDLKKDLQ
jgi:predicted HTH domain antitoxin